MNKILGSNSIPRFFLTDLRFLFEKPKELPDSRGSFRLEAGVEITGVAEEKTGKNHRRINVFTHAGFDHFHLKTCQTDSGILAEACKFKKRQKSEKPIKQACALFIHYHGRCKLL